MSLTVFVHGRTPLGEPRFAGLSFDAPRIVLGRGEGCEIRLPDVSVSHRHATVRQRGAEYLLVDEGSTNGTRIGRVRLSAHSPRVIRSGELARIGRVWVEFRIEATPPVVSKPQAAKELALELVASALAEQGEDARPCITIEEGPEAGSEVRLDAGARLVIGRSSEAGLSIDDADLSRRHAEVGRKGDVLVVRDLGSKAGTRIGEKDVGTTDVTWKAGERLTLGGVALTYTFPAVEALAEIERSPDEKVASSELDTGSGPEAAVVDAPEDPIAEDAPPPEEEESLELIEAAPAPARGQKWGATDFAVVLLALGVVCLSAVGYFVLLK